MSLQVFQAGLTWRMILNKRNGFRLAFDNWSINTVAGFGPDEVEAFRNDPGIIRNRLKIQATVENARTVLSLQTEHGSFCNWFYNVLEGTEYPALQKTLREVFKFMGPEISRMWLMASGRITRDGRRQVPSVVFPSALGANGFSVLILNMRADSHTKGRF